MELYGFMEREKKIPSYFFIITKMEKKSDEKEQKAHYLRREFAYSKYEQTLILPDDVEKEHIAARVVNGVLTVTLPKIKVDVQKIARQITVG
ncbi:MAG: Hsp20/alpha crystallin family protein [Prevotella histicola]|nr:Hsp20/alpha crystallin family protein [Prevotella histicola]